jgi:hypothetical protein
VGEFPRWCEGMRVDTPEWNDEDVGLTEWKPLMRDTSVWTSG